MTRGRRALLWLLQRTTRREVARRLRVDPSSVSRWASGAARPCARARRLLEAGSGYGIAASAWG